jgi:Flp pilus assembly protein TadG
MTMRSSKNDQGTGIEIRQKGRRRDGTSSLTVLFALVALIGAASLALDVGAMMVGRTQAQNASDAAALAAAATMIDTTGPSVDIPTGNTTAQAVSNNNPALDETSVSIATADITYGNWDLATRTFDATVDLTDPYQVTAVDVIARLDNTNNGPVPALMSRVLGRNFFQVSSQSTAYLGFAGGNISPGALDLPVAIPCCKIAGAACDDFCPPGWTPPNPCTVDSGDSPSDTVSCLEFHSTPDQNACWTEYDGDSPNINTPGLSDIVENGSPVEVNVPMPMYVDNGTKTPVIAEIEDKFKVNPPYTSPDDYNTDKGGSVPTDYYPPFNGTPDSWVVRLPVINCQDDDKCAGGDPATLEGVMCFEIREIIVTPSKIIKGTFMCPSHPRYDECEIGGTGGGGNFGIIADIPVLVR